MKETVNQIRKKVTQKRRYKNPLIEPDEIFLDSKNLPDFDTQQFEGQMERPIGRRAFWSVGIVFCFIMVLFGGKLWSLQVANGAVYKHLAENNSLNSEPIFASRGNIYDRNGVALVWNGSITGDNPWGIRSYIQQSGFSHVLGYVSYPAKDKSGNYWQKEVVGRDGIEKQYNTMLNGTNGSTIVERDISGKVQGHSMVDAPQAGKNLTLSIDSRLQSEMYKVLSTDVQASGFQSASGIVMDIKTGEVVTLTNFPEYDSNIISDGKDRETIHTYLTSAKTPLLDRAVAGLFVPGSIVKPYIGLEALSEGVVTATTAIRSIGSISIANQYDPAHPTIFRDYYPDNGYVTIREALELSSNIYFAEIAGGYESQKGIGIYNMAKAWQRFHITEKTGVDLPAENTGNIPSPEWKAAKFPGETWRLGDTYNTAIGQYGMQVTPIQMMRAVAAIATKGTIVVPHVLKDVPTISEKLPTLTEDEYTVVQEGMHMGAVHGTTADVTPVPFSLATKSGTAQVGAHGQNVNSWMTGFFPYENPRYAFVIMMENGPAPAIGTAHRATRQFLGWVGQNAPEYGQNTVN
jgi:penicillin-binding protein 2